MDSAGFYNRDCMDAMREFPDKFFSLAVVDVPYGIGVDKMTLGNGRRTVRHGTWDSCAPNEDYFSELFRVSKNQIIWGANHFISKIPIDSSCWIFWDKGTGDNDYADGELAWTSFNSVVKKYSKSWVGANAKEKNERDRIHICQKPIGLYAWILENYAKRGDKILDTHVGSASSLIACHRMGFEYWGYELDESYFKAATERLEREKSMQPLFAPQEIYKQEGLTFDT